MPVMTQQFILALRERNFKGAGTENRERIQNKVKMKNEK
jgi:hypothetical protein